MHTISPLSLVVVALLGVAGRPEPKPPAVSNPASPELLGQWRAQLQFTSGAFAAIKDLEFMYVFNSGGTMTESSNYDGAPPVPPAYGIWRNTGPKQFEVKYEFYVTKAPAAFEEISKGGGWGPAAAACSWKRSPCPMTASRSPRRSNTISSMLRASRPRVAARRRGKV